MTISKINRRFVSTEFFHFINDLDLPAVNFISSLFTDRTTDLQRCNTSEDLSTGTCFSTEFQRSFFEFLNYTIDLSQHFILFLLHLFHSFFELLPVARTVLNSQLSWQ